MRNLKSLIISFFFLMLATNLFAGSVIKIKSVKTVFEETIISEDIIYIQDGKIRSETIEDGNKSITIIDPTKGMMINIEPSEGSYVVLTEEDFSKFVQQIKMQKEKMLQQLPEEQREAMSAMIEQQMQQMKNQIKTEYKKTGNESFNGYNCEVYHGFILDEKVEEMWIAPWKNMKLKDDYVETFKGIETFFKKMAKNMGEYSDMIENSFDSEMFDVGFPVKTIEYENGNPIIIETLEEITEMELSPSLFEIPKDMVQRDFFEM